MKIASLLLLFLCALSCVLAVACSDTNYPGPQEVAAVDATEAPRFALVTGALPDAVADAEYSFALQFTGADETLTCEITSGALPPGVELANNGTISGTPRLTGDWTFELTAHSDGQNIVQTLTLPVSGVPGDAEIDQGLRDRLNFRRIWGLDTYDLPELNAEQVELGRLLFFDKELSGTRDVACATCHHPRHNYTDGLHLSVGVGGVGFGPTRNHPGKVVVPRNSPSIFNVALFPSMFWDSRVSTLVSLRRQSEDPTKATLTPEGYTDLNPVAAQALFPMADMTEMRGEGHGLDGLGTAEYRSGIVERLKTIPEYAERFEKAFGKNSMTVENMARAIAAFEDSQTYVNAPWDRYLRGETNALTDTQKKGASLFYGRARCVNCHEGALQTDFSMHNILVPQFGPGRDKGAAEGVDRGLGDVSGFSFDNYRFKTPSLRNIALTPPYMHNGAFNTLREVVLHYRDKAKSFDNYDPKPVANAMGIDVSKPPRREIMRTRSFLFNIIPNDLSDEEVDQIVAFLETLTDPEAVNRMNDVPETVPSGLPVDR